jgi:hypothetical protein
LNQVISIIFHITLKKGGEILSRSAHYGVHESTTYCAFPSFPFGKGWFG